MKKFSNVISVSRPFLWINTAFPFLAGWLLIQYELSWPVLVAFLFFLFPYNLAMYGINDIFDYESDIKNPRKASLEGALLEKQQLNTLWPYIFLWNVPCIVVLVITGNIFSTAILAFSLFMVVAYSIAGLRFKEIPILDSVTSSCHFVTPFLFGIAMHGGHFSQYIPIIISFFLWGMASHAFGAIQDIKYDREANIQSIATIFGARTTLYLCTLFYAVSAGVCYYFYHAPSQIFASLFILAFAINTIRFYNVTDDTAHTTNKGWHVFMSLCLGIGALFTTTMLRDFLILRNIQVFFPIYLTVIIGMTTFLFFAFILNKKSKAK